MKILFFGLTVFGFTLGQVFIDPLDATGGDGHPSRTHELKHTTQFLQLVVKLRDFFAHAVHLHNGEHGVHLDDAGMELADDFRHLVLVLQHRGSQFVEGNLVLVDFAVGEIMCLQHVYLLRYLLHHLLNRVFVCPCGDGVFMHALDGRCRHIEALDVDLPPREDGCHLIQQAGDIFRMDDDGI